MKKIVLLFYQIFLKGESNNFFIEEFRLINKMCNLPKTLIETENFKENLVK